MLQLLLLLLMVLFDRNIENTVTLPCFLHGTAEACCLFLYSSGNAGCCCRRLLLRQEARSCCCCWLLSCWHSSLCKLRKHHPAADRACSTAHQQGSPLLLCLLPVLRSCKFRCRCNYVETAPKTRLGLLPSCLLKALYRSIGSFSTRTLLLLMRLLLLSYRHAVQECCCYHRCL